MLQSALHAVVTFLAVTMAYRHAKRWPFLTTFAMICIAIMLRRCTAWAAQSEAAHSIAWIQRASGDIGILNNVVLPLLISIFMLVFVIETARYLGPYATKRGAVNGVVRHG